MVLFHGRRKVTGAQWARAVDSGKLVGACKALHTDRQRGPWHILCDNERFLDAGVAQAAHAKAGVRLWHIPLRSPDLNPAERMWAWMRRKLRAMDMADLRAGKAVVKKSALKTRIRGLCRTRAAHVAAGRCVRGRTSEQIR